MTAPSQQTSYSRLSLFCLIAAVLPTVCLSSSASPICPESPAAVHARCQMTIAFDQPCEQVKNEIQYRILLSSKNSTRWTDPRHNEGRYSLQNESVISATTLEASHVADDQQQQHADKLSLRFEDCADGTKGCTVRSCSTSQEHSIFDFSTNYCNLHNLYCNNDEPGCHSVKHELTYRETSYDDCWQRKVHRCSGKRSRS